LRGTNQVTPANGGWYAAVLANAVNIGGVQQFDGFYETWTVPDFPPNQTPQLILFSMA
jgi:hypothetical protein